MKPEGHMLTETNTNTGSELDDERQILRLCDVVLLQNNTPGIVRFISDHNINPIMIGLELAEPCNPKDYRIVEGLFECKPNHGILIELPEIGRKLFPEELLFKLVSLTHENNKFRETINYLEDKIQNLKININQVNISHDDEEKLAQPIVYKQKNKYISPRNMNNTLNYAHHGAINNHYDDNTNNYKKIRHNSKKYQSFGTKHNRNESRQIPIDNVNHAENDIAIHNTHRNQIYSTENNKNKENKDNHRNHKNNVNTNNNHILSRQHTHEMLTSKEDSINAEKNMMNAVAVANLNVSN